MRLVAVLRMRCRGILVYEAFCASNRFRMSFFRASSFSTVVSSATFAIDTHCTLSDGKHINNILYFLNLHADLFSRHASPREVYVLWRSTKEVNMSDEICRRCDRTPNSKKYVVSFFCEIN